MKNDKLKFETVKSGFGKLEGKYTGQFVSNGSDGLDEIADAICAAHPTVGRAEVKLAIRALGAEIRQAVGEGLNYVTTGSVAAFAPSISGSLAAMDSALVEGENEFYVNIIALDHLKKAIGELVPTQANPSGANVRFTSVEDALTKTKGVIYGTSEFVITGYNLSADGDGESLSLVKPDGTLAATCSVTGGDGLGQRISARLATAVDKGDYRLLLASRGYATQQADVENYTKKVTVLET